MKIGFIGLGRMGGGMAANLARSGVDLVVYDAVTESAQPVVAQGASLAASVGELTRQCGVVFTSLPGPIQVEQVALGEDGVLANAREGLAYFDLSTSSLSLAKRLHSKFAEAGAAMLDAPVSGGPEGAATGDLVIWARGDKDVFDRHLDVLTILAKSPLHVGDTGAGTVTKLAHNLLGYMILESLAEAFTLGTKAGVDPLDLWEAMRLGLVGKRSPLDMLVNQFLPGQYEPPAFLLKLAHKDVTLATSLGNELGVPMRVAGHVLEEMTEALGRGFGEQDSRAYLKLQTERAGVNIAVDPQRLAEAVTRIQA